MISRIICMSPTVILFPTFQKLFLGYIHPVNSVLHNKLSKGGFMISRIICMSPTVILLPTLHTLLSGYVPPVNSVLHKEEGNYDITHHPHVTNS